MKSIKSTGTFSASRPRSNCTIAKQGFPVSIHRYPNGLTPGTPMFCQECQRDKRKGYWLFWPEREIDRQALFVCDDCLAMARKVKTYTANEFRCPKCGGTAFGMDPETKAKWCNSGEGGQPLSLPGSGVPCGWKG